MATVPNSTEDVKNAFRGLVPAADGVAVKPMFGNLAAFVNGNMFAGLFGDKLFVRVADPERDRLIAAGGADFAPMAGRPMKGYVTLPEGWRSAEENARGWVQRALAGTSALPPKEARGRKAPKKK